MFETTLTMYRVRIDIPAVADPSAAFTLSVNDGVVNRTVNVGSADSRTGAELAFQVASQLGEHPDVSWDFNMLSDDSISLFTMSESAPAVTPTELVDVTEIRTISKSGTQTAVIGAAIGSVATTLLS